MDDGNGNGADDLWAGLASFILRYHITCAHSYVVPSPTLLRQLDHRQHQHQHQQQWGEVLNIHPAPEEEDEEDEEEEKEEEVRQGE